MGVQALEKLLVGLDRGIRSLYSLLSQVKRVASQLALEYSRSALSYSILNQAIRLVDHALCLFANTTARVALLYGLSTRWQALQVKAKRLTQATMSIPILYPGAEVVLIALIGSSMLLLIGVLVFSLLPAMAAWYFLDVFYSHRAHDGDAALKANARAIPVLHHFDPKARAIRILEIRPGRRGDPISCKLHVSTIDTASYEALSYVWGSPSFGRRITIGGVPVNVTRNLYSALSYLRYEDKPRMLWIDALCIDQSDAEDRAQQVGQMRDIYESARQVIVWLGEGTWGVEAAFSNALGTTPVREYSYTVARVMSRLLRQSWWERVWVVQELVVAKVVTVQCGRHSLPWESFCQLVDAYLGMPQADPDETHVEAFRALRHHRATKLQNSDSRYGLLSLVHDFRHKHASDSRDKIYAFLGLVSQSGVAVAAPDYTMDHTTLCHVFAINCIDRTNSLAVIALADGDSPEAKTWLQPRSWCPYWYAASSGQRPTPLWSGDIDNPDDRAAWQRPFSASGLQSTAMWRLGRNFSLKVKGILHEEVVSVGISAGPSLREYLESYARKSLPHGAWPSVPFFRVKLNWEDALPQWQDMAMSGVGSRQEVIARFHQTITAGMFDRVPEAPGENSAYATVRDDVCAGRTFFVTSTGSFGLGPWHIRVGDRLAVLLGCDVPLILRELDSSDSEPARPALDIGYPQADNLFGSGFISGYRYIGQAYVQDRMFYEGDIRADREAAGLSLDDITLL